MEITHTKRRNLKKQREYKQKGIHMTQTTTSTYQFPSLHVKGTPFNFVNIALNTKPIDINHSTSVPSGTLETLLDLKSCMQGLGLLHIQ